MGNFAAWIRNMEYRGFNDYAVEVMEGEQLLGAFGWVSNLFWLVLWLNIHPRYRKWDSMRVYHRLSSTLIGVYSREGAIPAKPRL